MTQYTDFGRAVRHALVDANRTTSWLACEVKARTGLYVDTSYLHRIFTGKRNAPKIVAGIRDVLHMEEETNAKG